MLAISTNMLCNIEGAAYRSESSHHGADSILLWGLLKVVEGACFVKVSIFISLVGFSLSDLVGRIRLLIPSHMLFFDYKSGVKGGANFVGFWRCFYWWLLLLSCLQFLPHSCISSLVSRDLVPSFSLNFITSICVADYVSLSGMENFLENFLNHYIYSSLVMYWVMVQQISRKWWYESIRKCWFAYCLCRFTC